MLKILFLGLLKHYKIGGSAIFMIFVVEREEHGKNYNWNFWIWDCFVQKWPYRDAYLFFKKCLAETPIFIVFFGCARFWPSCQKGKFWTPTKKKRKID